VGRRAAANEPVFSGGGRQSLADALLTSTQQRLFGLLFGQPKRSFFVTELIELAGAGRGAVQRSRIHGKARQSAVLPSQSKYFELGISRAIGFSRFVLLCLISISR